MKIELTSMPDIRLTAENGQDQVWLERFCIEMYENYPELSETDFITDQDEINIKSMIHENNDDRKTLFYSNGDLSELIIRPFTRSL